MTLPPERIGDKGQRYVVKAQGWPSELMSEIAYFDDKDQALKVLGAICLRPSFETGYVLDRGTGDGIFLVDDGVSPTQPEKP